ncbi:MAG: hypothetical protein HYR64_03770 [Fimbriimonas ginsengisoli]|uniref:Uncharacterized protein n=1 Tax=Fimbriimonas ginsengisoli TaxID=1005039 RepID=A0A931PU61_FIMGI|nr:hypothetical protein [Fimbriimonas ginsengisoli]
MNITLALLADAANVSREGKLNVLGVFNTIGASKFPVRHPRMVLVFRVEWTNAEAGTARDGEIKLMDADGREHAKIDFRVSLPREGHGPVYRSNEIIDLTDTLFPHEGEYAVAILVNGEEKARTELTIRATPRADGGPPPESRN